MSIEKIKENIWKINADSNIYFLNFKKKILIDCGNRNFIRTNKKEISSLTNLEDIEVIILTHLHYDHCGCLDLFPNAKIYVSAEELRSLNEDSYGTVLNDDILAFLINFKFQELETLGIDDIGNDFHIINTPGHTKGSICLYYKKEKILFSGDTLFYNDNIGRHDFPTSEPAQYGQTLNRIKKIDYDILCPGHDY